MKTSNFIPLLFLTIPLSFFFACTQDNKQEIKQEIKMRSDSTHSQKKIIFINTFTSSPETDSCACFFSTDSTSYHNQSYIFAYNLSTLAYMKINGEMITFKQTEYIIMGKNSVT
ncbi:MAG TPA: hypothetical protein VLB84_09680, partial [Bacteroidia bacterium]|nr:hypothetical protein [Bacteroidia bacterium]